MHPLDDPAGSALRTLQGSLGRRRGRVAAFDRDVSPFASIPADATSEEWAALADLVGPGARVALPGASAGPMPEGWTLLREIDVIQMVAEGEVVDPRPAGPEALLPLGVADVPEMLALVRATEPGPFEERTVEFGGYRGIREGDAPGGELLAMAGRRLALPGFTEVSAVCTAPAARGRGYGARLVVAVSQALREEGSTPFLHVAMRNPARALYDRLGFRVRRELPFVLVESPV